MAGGVTVHKIVSRWDVDRVLWEGEAASLRDAMEKAFSSGANLRGANLSGANLGGANLGGAYLGGAYLGGAYLDGAYLGGANLDGADLRGANLGGANLRGANLRGANLGGANLRGANLSGANLGGADLDGANLGGDRLQRAGVSASRSDGYEFRVFQLLDGTLKILAGCRWFTVAEARTHWRQTRGGTPLGEESLALVDHLERMARIAGWLLPTHAEATV